MGPSGWRHFDDRTCQLGPKNASSPPKSSKVTGKATLECWDGLNGGRPEAWYLACCNMGFANCWSDDYTPERCCPWPPQTPAPDPPLGLDVLQEFLNFSENEVQLFLAALKDSGGHPTGGSRLLCLAPKDCAKEAFARLFFGFWHQKLLPLRHPWLVNHEEDQLSGVNLILRSTNQGQYPQGQEHIVERVQVAHFLSKVQRHLDDPSFRWPSQPRRCLEWDSGGYSRHFFRDFCQVIDVLTYHGEGVASMRDNGPAANGKIDYFVDIHLADQVIPENSTAMVICAQVFEHLSQPFVAMKQIYRLLAPGGLLAWTVPLFSEIHGAPQDFWRFTPGGANRLALYAGFEVVQIYAPGGLRETTGSLLGMTKPYWREEEILEDRHDPWPLQAALKFLRREALAQGLMVLDATKEWKVAGVHWHEARLAQSLAFLAAQTHFSQHVLDSLWQQFRSRSPALILEMLPSQAWCSDALRDFFVASMSCRRCFAQDGAWREAPVAQLFMPPSAAQRASRERTLSKAYRHFTHAGVSPEAAFAKLDTDQDGEVTPQDFAENGSFELPKERLRLFETLDTAKRGSISAEEWMAAFEITRPPVVEKSQSGEPLPAPEGLPLDVLRRMVPLSKLDRDLSI
eukprot:symbB.v1.2.017447.t2/scaffold1356.1/size123658/1